MHSRHYKQDSEQATASAEIKSKAAMQLRCSANQAIAKSARYVQEIESGWPQIEFSKLNCLVKYQVS